ncbi:MAG: hypothetical protein IT260_19805 [Saprospiraceae bacterium]|nr:hypothetical protein [Saprospiraceae bacterium]
MKQNLVFALAAAVFLTACGPSNPSTEASQAGSPATTAAGAYSTKPEWYVYSATVENLRLRDQPDQSSAVLAQIKEGDLAEGAGVVSDKQEEVALRGISIQAPYLQVEAASKRGWAFGGGLVCVYSGAQANVPNRQALTELGHFLKGLSTKSVESGGKAWAYVNQHFSTAQGPLADGAFVLLENYLHRLEIEGEFYQLTEKMGWKNEDIQAVYDGTFDPNSQPTTQSLVANGFRLVTGEGMIFPVIDRRKFQAFFAEKGSIALKQFLAQRTAEQNQPMYDDGGVVVPMEKIADHAVVWEKFNRDFPYFLLREETLESEKWLRLTLINGADNTPAFDYESGSVNEEFKKTWAYVQQKYPDTQLAALAKQMSEICGAEGWKKGKKTEAFQAKLAEEYMSR